MEIKAYAKINLTLDISGKRADGYHNIESVMQSISLADTLEIRENNLGKIYLSSNVASLPTDESNTAFKAAKLFYEYTEIKNRYVDIRLDKQIPDKAGMGGGSSDAAAVLWAMNEIYKTNLTMPELFRLGAKIGADVPFCLAGGTCHCRGIGEKIARVDPMPACFLLICKPPAGVSTPRAYAMVDKLLFSAPTGTPKMITALKGGNLQHVSAALSNRFDEVLFLPQVQNIKKVMRTGGALNAMMTGSGSAVYGIFEDLEHARSCAQDLHGYGDLFLAKPINV
ncbi:4-(cytidine 5'-diphospho)-2-C-methyl-D-erythritol kinase [Scatolibacter rhodanostii]|uniref:4-(cytidine 5'-diphospho)-2-C-methyl-D-erythritol kinase n=1 Tax=Scatolibacter rhodanostii TaxID=2014781 RepID=UPI000C06A194|nr:4-(cytidine 5'-diphospho)-2-C-methyl-D-erythritol kinase [Scatolibacter rhodanostii]